MRSLFALCIVILTGCQNGFSTFYHPYFDRLNPPPNLALTELKYLGKDEIPQIFSSDDLARDIKIARSQSWIPIGYSSFNGVIGTQAQLTNQAKVIGASMVISTSKFAENRVISTPLFLPNNKTTYYNGTTNGQVVGAYGGSATYNATTTGTATTYGTTVVPLTTVQARYDQTAVYFVRNQHKFKFGTILLPLPPNSERNMKGTQAL